MNSWATLTALRDDFTTYIENNSSFSFIIELRQEDDVTLSERSDIAQFRIGLYEQSNEVGFTVENGKAYEGTQSYEMSLFYRVSRKGDNDEDVEQYVMDMKDIIVEWLYQLDVDTVTSSELYNLTFINNTSPDRQEDYTSMTFDLEGDRNLV